MFKSNPVASALALLLALGTANAAPVAGTFNTSGYDVFTINVGTDSRVDFLATGGYSDPSIMLFDGSGHHIISNDDSGSLNFHLTRDLAAGHYSVLVTYCCSFSTPLYSGGASFVYTDGFNSGSYLVGGTATLAGVTNYLLNQPPHYWANGSPYELRLTNAEIAKVPEPATLALAGLGLLAAAGVRRRRA